MKEKAILFGDGKGLLGILTEPQGSSADLGVVILNSGLLHRMGPNRLHVKMNSRGLIRLPVCFSMAAITRIDIQAANRWGRPTRFVITDAQGRRYSLGGEEIRWAVNTDAENDPYKITNPNTLYSSFFRSPSCATTCSPGRSIR